MLVVYLFLHFMSSFGLRLSIIKVISLMTAVLERFLFACHKAFFLPITINKLQEQSERIEITYTCKSWLVLTDWIKTCGKVFLNKSTSVVAEAYFPQKLFSAVN